MTINNPYPNINVSFRLKPYSLFINQDGGIVEYSKIKEVTNYEYEVEKNENKRQILVLKKEYLGAVIQDMKNIMKYDKSSQTIDNKTKRTYNSKLSDL